MAFIIGFIFFVIMLSLANVSTKVKNSKPSKDTHWSEDPMRGKRDETKGGK